MLSMHVHILSILWALALASAERYFPRVTKSIVDVPQDEYFYWRTLPQLDRFDESECLLLNFRGRLYVSFNDGEDWQRVTVAGTALWFSIDTFHRGRAFVGIATQEDNQEIHFTEDQGKNWRKLAIPGEVEENQSCHITTHPFDSELLLLDCSIWNEKYLGTIIYASNDAGKSFRNIVGAPDLPDEDASCEFATSSKESTLERDGIYCVHTVDNTTGTQVQYPNPHPKGLAEVSFHQEHQSVGTLFYTMDFGKTRKTFDELNGYSVERMFVLPHGIAVTTSGDNYFKDRKLWISNGTSFNLAHLPVEVDLIMYVGSLTGDDQRLQAAVLEAHRRIPSLLVSDNSGLNFSFWVPTPELQSSDIAQTWSSIWPSGLKGTLWGTFGFYKDVEDNGNLLQRVLNLLKNVFTRKSPTKMLSMTKGSFDNGKTWTNLKVVDPSEKHRHLFKCDINDVEHCSFHQGYGCNKKSTIIMKTGTVGENYDDESGKDDMTFISRDGGVSWELAFEFPVRAEFLDFGNIIVAIEDRLGYGKRQNEPYTKFFFSLDQGRTWGEYHFEEPIHDSNVEFQGHGLKAHMGFMKYNKESIEYIFYTFDFSNAFNGTVCTENDWERWYLSDGNCIDGMRYSYDRRKPDAKCLMRKTFDKLELHEERCEC